MPAVAEVPGALTAGVDHLLLAHRIAARRELGERALLDAVDALGVAGDVPRARELREAVEACADTSRRSFTLGCLTASAGQLEDSVAQLLAGRRAAPISRTTRTWSDRWSRRCRSCAYAGRGAEAIDGPIARLADDGATPTVVGLTARQGLAFGLRPLRTRA